MCVGGRTTAIYGGELSSFLRKIIFRWQRLLEVRPAAQKNHAGSLFSIPVAKSGSVRTECRVSFFD